jgi:hypothetical protein
MIVKVRKVKRRIGSPNDLQVHIISNSGTWLQKALSVNPF